MINDVKNSPAVAKADTEPHIVGQVAGFDIRSDMFNSIMGMNDVDTLMAAIDMFAELYELKTRNFDAAIAASMIGSPYLSRRTISQLVQKIAGGHEALVELLKGWPSEPDPASFLIQDAGLELFLDGQRKESQPTAAPQQAASAVAASGLSSNSEDVEQA